MLHHWESALPILLAVLCPLLNTAAAESPLVPALLGVNLGSTHITAATINGSGTFPLALVEGSQVYINFMNNTTNSELPLEDYYDDAFNVMKQIINDVRSRASHNNGKDMRIGAILAPEHCTWQMRRLVYDSWYAVDNAAWAPSVRPVSYSAVVYPENDCIDRLYNMKLPDDQGEWVLVFHQDFDYLSVSLSMVTTYMFETTSKNIAMPTVADDIFNFLLSADDYEEHPNITSVVLSSHDGNADFQVVREALDKFDVQLWKKRKNSTLELEYMAAAGAACMARQRAIFPMEDDGCQYPVPDDEETMPPHLHGEL